MSRAIVLAVLVSVCGGCNWPWQHDMADQPSPNAAQGPRPPAVGAVPLDAAGPSDPAAGEAVADPLPSDARTIDAGQRLYQMYCTPCHGPTGSGEAAAVSQYFPRVGDLRSRDVQQHGDGWLYATITRGTELMPPYGHELDPRERWQIVRYLRALAQ